MKTGALIIALLLLVGCASQPVRCSRRLTPINASLGGNPRARTVWP